MLLVLGDLLHVGTFVLSRLVAKQIPDPESVNELESRISKQNLKILRSSDRNAFIEKIGNDLYYVLSINFPGTHKFYYVPTCRLAMLPLINEYTQTHELAAELYDEIN